MRGAVMISGCLESVVIIGAGGHAKVCIDVIRQLGRYNIIGCLSSAGSSLPVLGVPIIGDNEILPTVLRAGCKNAFVAIGDNQIRDNLASQLIRIGFTLPSAIHPNAIVSSSAAIGNGVLIMPGTVINAEAKIEDVVIINSNAVVEHDCHIGRASHIAPGAVLAGNVRVGKRTFLGAGVVVRPGITIGDDIVAGSGAVIVKNFEMKSLIVGVPAKST